MFFTIILASLVSLVVYAIANYTSTIITKYASKSKSLTDLLTMMGMAPKTSSSTTNIGHVFSSSPEIVPCQKKESVVVDKFGEALKKYQEENNSRVIFINHRDVKGPMGLSMFDSTATLSLKDATDVMTILKTHPEGTTLDLIMNTTGGSMTAAEIIINAFRNSKCKVRVYVPYYAMSAGTLIAITIADELYLGKNAFMGPVDPQFAFGFSAASIVRFTEQSTTSNTSSTPTTPSTSTVPSVFSPASWVSDVVRLGHRSAQAALDRVHNLIKNVYKSREFDDKYSSIAIEELVGKYNHDQPIFYEQLSSIVPMKVVHGLPTEVSELFDYHNSDGEKPRNSPFGF